MLTKTISDQLQTNYQDLFDWLASYPEEDLNKDKVPGKWTAAQHLDHLIRCTGPLNKGLRLPKPDLEERFGTLKRPEMNYEELVKKYQGILRAGGGSGPSRYFPDLEAIFSKQDLLAQLKKELSDLKEILAQWNNTDMSTYILPHPAVGDLSIHEIMYHAVYHCEHHLKQLKEKY